MSHNPLVVDLCGTIVKQNTTHGFLRSEWFPGWRKRLAALILSRAGGVFLSRLLAGQQRALLILLLRGLDQEELRQWAEKYAEKILREHPREDVLDAIRERKRAAQPIYVASASLDFIVEAFAKVLGADGYVATELVYRRGRCAGFVERDSTGVKLALLVADLGVEPKGFDVITDNPEDTDLMNSAVETWFIEDE